MLTYLEHTMQTLDERNNFILGSTASFSIAVQRFCINQTATIKKWI